MIRLVFHIFVFTRLLVCFLISYLKIFFTVYEDFFVISFILHQDVLVFEGYIHASISLLYVTTVLHVTSSQAVSLLQLKSCKLFSLIYMFGSLSWLLFHIVFLLVVISREKTLL